nr:helix-turn-helix transcriptional regulator [Candidatus Stoquefichus massiliensis]
MTAFKDRRSAYSISQTRLAVMAGMSREQVSRIESGKVKKRNCLYL